jgi:hypothetical protein
LIKEKVGFLAAKIRDVYALETSYREGYFILEENLEKPVN